MLSFLSLTQAWTTNQICVALQLLPTCLSSWCKRNIIQCHTCFHYNTNPTVKTWRGTCRCQDCAVQGVLQGFQPFTFMYNRFIWELVVSLCRFYKFPFVVQDSGIAHLQVSRERTCVCGKCVYWSCSINIVTTIQYIILVQQFPTEDILHTAKLLQHIYLKYFNVL